MNGPLAPDWMCRIMVYEDIVGWGQFHQYIGLGLVVDEDDLRGVIRGQDGVTLTSSGGALLYGVVTICDCCSHWQGDVLGPRGLTWGSGHS